VAQFIVTMLSDGRIASQGSFADALANNSELFDKLEHGKTALETDGAEIKMQEKTTNDDGKLIFDEEVQDGNISMHACKPLLSQSSELC
jgi:hypothetical protein